LSSLRKIREQPTKKKQQKIHFSGGKTKNKRSSKVFFNFFKKEKKHFFAFSFLPL